MKVAMTGTSGSGKTTLVKYVEKEYGLKHISGSSGDIQTIEDKNRLCGLFGILPGCGHLDVIKNSAKSFGYGMLNQELNRVRRAEIIEQNDDFVTDRSPIDNLTYLISQVGFHNEFNDRDAAKFAAKCLQTWNLLTHVIYIKAVQPNGVENNGSRIANKWYQLASDAQFDYWVNNYFAIYQNITGPKLLIIDYWDLDKRKKAIREFLNT